MAKVVAASGEVIIHHPEVRGAIMRISASDFDPEKHEEWDADDEPTHDGSGHRLADQNDDDPTPKAAKTKGGRFASKPAAGEEG